MIVGGSILFFKAGLLLGVLNKNAVPLKTSTSSINIFQGLVSSPCYQTKYISPATPPP